VPLPKLTGSHSNYIQISLGKTALFAQSHSSTSSSLDSSWKRMCSWLATSEEYATSHTSTFSGISRVLSIVCFNTFRASFLAARTDMLGVYSDFKIACAAWLFAPIAVAVRKGTFVITSYIKAVHFYKTIQTRWKLWPRRPAGIVAGGIALIKLKARALIPKIRDLGKFNGKRI